MALFLSVSFPYALAHSDRRDFAERLLVQSLKNFQYHVNFVLRLRAYPNNRVVMRTSEKFEAKAAGQERPPEVVYVTLRTFLADNAGIGLCSRPQ